MNSPVISTVAVFQRSWASIIHASMSEYMATVVEFLSSLLMEACCGLMSEQPGPLMLMLYLILRDIWYLRDIVCIPLGRLPVCTGMVTPIFCSCFISLFTVLTLVLPDYLRTRCINIWYVWPTRFLPGGCCWMRVWAAHWWWIWPFWMLVWPPSCRHICVQRIGLDVGTGFF